MPDFYRIMPLRDGAYRITSKENVFMDLFIGSHHALLWDTGYGFGDIPALVRELTDLPLIVVNSHGHPDHACGNYLFKDPVCIHPDDIDLCRKQNSREKRSSALYGAKNFLNYELKKVVSLLPEGFDEAAYPDAPSPALSPVTDGYIFDLGGIELEVVHLPGHTRGSIGLLWRAERLLYVGDAIAGFLFLFLPESMNLSTYKATLDKAEALPFDFMVPGHGFDPMPKAQIQDFRNCVNTLDYEKGLPFEPMAGMDEVPGARICLPAGMTMESFAKPGFCAIVVAPGHMD